MLHINTYQCKNPIVPESWFGQPKYSTPSKNHPTLCRFLLLYILYFSGHGLSKTKSVTPNIFCLFDKSRSLPFCVASLKKKSVRGNFWARTSLILLISVYSYRLQQFYVCVHHKRHTGLKTLKDPLLRVSVILVYHRALL